MPSTPTTILLVDDHVLIRDALALLIKDFDNCTIIGVAEDGQVCIDKLKAGLAPDIIILDLSMPVLDGFATAAWLKENRPAIKVLVLTMFDSEVALIRLLKMGVRGFMKKDISTHDLRLALTAIAQEGYYYCNASTGKLAAFFNTDKQGKSPMDNTNLTEVEIEFLQHCATDMPYKEIAQKLHMTLRTIDATRDKLFLKLDVKSRVGLAIYAVKSGIVGF
jgi:two-component system, NarL family, invasion response regulator UvrY